MPDLSRVRGLSPAVPAPSALRAGPVLLVATCFDCQSGDVIGGAMRRLAERELPGAAQVRVVGWDGDARAWRERWSLPSTVGVHRATTPGAIAQAKQLLGVDETGYAYLYDAEGRWRSSFAVQLMQSDDIVHDMRAID